MLSSQLKKLLVSVSVSIWERERGRERGRLVRRGPRER